MSQLWNSDHVHSIVDPWADIKPDAKVQTGGDWYGLLLTASLGGRAIHGVNMAPSCEVLCKSRREHEYDEGVGLLTWDDSVKAPSTLGRDVSDQFYLHKPYRGNITASGSILAYESGLWEPSVRRRARSSALLAAGLVVHGMSSVDACGLVGKITGEPIDIQAVDNAIVPASHLKREMVLVSKASHRIFSRGTIQSGLTWHDDRIQSRTVASNMAFDWGRITAIARYIGEANVQNCGQFRRIAKTHGIPFAVVRNSWAYVSEADYHLPLSLFDKVPKIDLQRLQIPSLVGTFIGHEHEVMHALNRGQKYLSIVPENEAFRAYMKVHKDAQERGTKRRKIREPLSSEAHEVHIVEHTLTVPAMRELVHTGRIIRDSFLSAIACQRQSDPALDRLLNDVAQINLDLCTDYSLIDRASQVIYGKTTWILARSIAESALIPSDNPDDFDRSQLLDKITSRLLDMKSYIIGYKSHLESDFRMAPSQYEPIRQQTIVNAQQSSGRTVRVNLSQRNLASASIRAAASALSGIGQGDGSIFTQLKEITAKIYDEWYEKIADDDEPSVKNNLAYFAFISTFAHDLTATLCYQRESGYIEGTLPRRSYVYQGLLKTAPDYGFVPPRLRKYTYSHAFLIAEEIDRSGVVPYSVRDAAEKVLEVADLIVGDLMVGKIWQPDPETFFSGREKYAKPLSPGYDDSMLRDVETEHQIRLLLLAMEEERQGVTTSGYETCLNTYPNPNFADEIARLNGYPNLRAAYEVLGNKAYYSEVNEFVINARTRQAFASDNSSDSDDGIGPSSAAGTAKKRKYDAII